MCLGLIECSVTWWKNVCKTENNSHLCYSRLSNLSVHGERTITLYFHILTLLQPPTHHTHAHTHTRTHTPNHSSAGLIHKYNPYEKHVKGQSSHGQSNT